MKRIQELRGKYFKASSASAELYIENQIFFLSEIDAILAELQEIKIWYSLGGK